jgi:hypothetical protein
MSLFKGHSGARIRLAALTAAALTCTGLAAPADAAVPSWTKVSIVNPGSSPSFSTMTCLSSTNCWSPGYRSTTHKGTTSTYAVMEHWDGARWSPMSTPVGGAELGRVDCASAAECWAAGYTEASSGLTTPVVERWDGRTWNKVLLPVPSVDKDAYVDSVTCLSSSDCFALGGAGVRANAPFSPLVFHFDGTKWSVMAKVGLPAGYKSADLEEMRCPSPANCVAEGVEIPQGSYFDHVYSQIFNGSTWKVVQMPQPYNMRFSYSDAPDLSCPSPGQCVAPVDAAPDANGQTAYTPFLEVWGGTSWRLLSAASASKGTFGNFTDMACLADNDCWATMSAGTGSEVDEWSGGSSWSAGSAPGAATSSFDAVACIPAAACFLLGVDHEGVAIADRLVVP